MLRNQRQFGNSYQPQCFHNFNQQIRVQAGIGFQLYLRCRVLPQQVGDGNN